VILRVEGCVGYLGAIDPMMCAILQETSFTDQRLILGYEYTNYNRPRASTTMKSHPGADSHYHPDSAKTIHASRLSHETLCVLCLGKQAPAGRQRRGSPGGRLQSVKAKHKGPQKSGELCRGHAHEVLLAPLPLKRKSIGVAHALDKD
jgi:hypothetical protein